MLLPTKQHYVSVINKSAHLSLPFACPKLKSSYLSLALLLICKDVIASFYSLRPFHFASRTSQPYSPLFQISIRGLSIISLSLCAQIARHVLGCSTLRTMDSGRSLRKVEKLSDGNFHSWKHNIALAMSHRELDVFLDPTLDQAPMNLKPRIIGSKETERLTP